MNDERIHHLGEYIKHLRVQRDMTIREVATKADLDSGALTRLEHGQVTHPRPDTLCALALTLKVPLADMFAQAGYTLPDELPGVESYLRTKYDCLSTQERLEITDIVEKFVRLHSQEPNDKNTHV